MAGEMMAQGAPEAAAAAPQEGGGDQVTELIVNISEGMGMLAEAMAGVNPEIGAKLESLASDFQATMEGAMGAAQAPQAAPTGGAPEAAKGGAVPAGPQGLPRG